MKINKIKLLSMVSAFLIAVSFLLINTKENKDQKLAIANSSELRFTEKSIDKKIIGNIMPASCESYPGEGVAHSDQDSYGTCQPCPSGTEKIIKTYSLCSVYIGEDTRETYRQTCLPGEYIAASSDSPACRPVTPPIVDPIFPTVNTHFD